MEISKIKIDKGVKIPPTKTSTKWPFALMKRGDSFIAGEYSRLNMAKFSNAARAWAKYRKNGWKFCVRKTSENKVRLFRIK